MKKITINKDQLEILKNHALLENPNEACAILFGKQRGENSIVEEIFLTENIEKSEVNFTISNELLLHAYNIAEKKKMQVVGIFHSHPTSEAIPSNTDKQFMQTNPVVWIIYSGMKDSFKAYEINSEIMDVQIDIQG